MPRIEPSSKKTYENQTGVQTFPVNEEFSMQRVCVEGDTGVVVVKFRFPGMTQFMNVDSNELAANTPGVWSLGAVAEIEVTPTNLANPYILSVCAF